MSTSWLDKALIVWYNTCMQNRKRLCIRCGLVLITASEDKQFTCMRCAYEIEEVKVLQPCKEDDKEN